MNTIFMILFHCNYSKIPISSRQYLWSLFYILQPTPWSRCHSASNWLTIEAGSSGVSENINAKCTRRARSPDQYVTLRVFSTNVAILVIKIVSDNKYVVPLLCKLSSTTLLPSILTNYQLPSPFDASLLDQSRFESHYLPGLFTLHYTDQLLEKTE